MIGSHTPSFLNKHYICEVCGKDLGTRYDRLKGTKCPNANITNGKTYCDKCETQDY